MTASCAAVYARVAASEYPDETALAAQINEVQAYAERQGYMVQSVYSDIGSGRVEDRPGLQRLLIDAQAGLFTIVILRDISRLFRDFVLAELYLNRLSNELGLDVVLAYPGIVWKGGEA